MNEIGTEIDEKTRPISAVRTRLTEVDLLRLVAALSVMLYHYLFSGHAAGYIPVSFPALSEVARYGYLGVDLFFVISGFVVLMSAWGRTPRGFVASRVSRLYPAYWVAVSVTAVVTALIGFGTFTVNPVQYLANLTMLNSLVDVRNIDVVYWTLWAEVRFYAIVLLLVVVGTTRRRALTFLWVWLGATLVVELGVLPAQPAALADLVVQSQFSHYFIAGMALFLVRRFGLTPELGVILLASLGNAVVRGVGFASRVAERYATAIDPVVVAVTIVVILLVMTAVALDLTRPLARPWFAPAGDLTYPLYLIHAHVGFLVIALLAGTVPDGLLVGGMVVVMCAAAYTVNVVVERPLTPRLRRLLAGAGRAGGRARDTPHRQPS